MARLTGGQAVVESLLAQGVDTVFGVISIHTLHIFDALYHQQGRIRVIGGRHEHAVASMADGYARVTGRPGVLLTSTGPGAADSVGGMGEAYHSSTPLLQITTNVEKEFVNSRRGVTHEPKDQLEMFRSVTGWCALVDSVESIGDHIEEAFQRFHTRHPRPIELEVPTDLLEQQAEVEVMPPRSALSPSADPAQVERAVQKLRSAKRPVIWAANGVMMSGATPELVRLAEALDCPVVTGDGGKGAFPEDHPLSLGTALGRRIWGDNPVQEFVGTCDLCLVVGSSLPYRTTVGVGLRMPQELVHIDIDPEMFGRNYPTSVGLAGDAKAVLGQLLQALGGQRVQRSSVWQREMEELKKRTSQGLKEQYPNQLRVWEGIRSVLPRDAVMVVDPTVPAQTLVRCFPMYEPNSWVTPHGWVGIGFAFPASLGAKVGSPQRTVVCITGDGGFQYNMQELGTAVQYGIAPVVLIFNDNAWGVLNKRQQDLFQGRVMATELTNPDFVRLAEAYGVEAVSVSDLDGLLRELERAVKSDRIQLIEVRTPKGFAHFR
ncbi:MAG: thiamine pyrophosphate-binding protein [Chloroflexi bacterium]|nr:thiamine pyrophosphate-binding protein [Chloroflexota bacterium]